MQSHTEEVRSAIRTYITEAVAYRSMAPVSDSESLVRGKLLDSLAMLSLISFMEQAFELTVADEEVDPEHFDSIDSLTAFVLRKLALARTEAA